MGALQFHSPLRLTIKMVNVPKSRRTYCKKCKTHNAHKVTQYKKPKERSAAQDRRRYDRKQQGYSWTDEIHLQKEGQDHQEDCVEDGVHRLQGPKQIPLKRCKHFELGGDKKRKGQMIQF